MNETIAKYIKGCVMCSTSKPSNKKFGLYILLPLPSIPWRIIYMDFIGLPISRKRHDYLYIVVDRFSKNCILVPCKNQVTAKHIAHMFFSNVWVHFGLPTSIILDWDFNFMGGFWSTLWGLMDAKMKKSKTFHPQTNAQIEVVNRTMVHLLKGYCNKHPKLWDESLHYVQHAYNQALHSFTSKSPFQTCFGHLPKSPIAY